MAAVRTIAGEQDPWQDEELCNHSKNCDGSGIADAGFSGDRYEDRLEPSDKGPTAESYLARYA